MIRLALIITLFFLFPSFISAQSIAAGLVGHWKFDEGSGTVATDSSGNNNTGILTNGPTWTVGKISSAINFDGVNDIINAGSGASLDNLGSISLSLWINPAALLGLPKHIVGKTNDGVGSNGWRLSITDLSGNPMVFKVDYTTTDLERRSAANTLTSGAWQHIVIVWDGTTSGSGIRMYKNGAEIAYGYTGTASGTRVNDGNSNFLIGSDQGTSRPYAGLMDDVRIYNRVLTSQDIQELYNLGSQTPTPPPPAADTTPPTLSGGSPTGTLPAGTVSATLSVSTNESATCKYGTAAGVSYSSIVNTFSTTGGISHQASVSGLQDGQNYTYYIRCQDGAGNATLADAVILFSVASPASPPSSPTPGTRIASRFFEKHSTWYEKIPASPIIHPNSNTIINYINSFTASLGSSYSQFSHPIYYADSNTPHVTVSVTNNAAAASAFGWNIVPIPDHARPAGFGGSASYYDGHMIVISYDRKYAWEMYQAVRTSATQWRAATLRRWDLDSDGLNTPYDSLGAVRLCPAPLLHGLVTYEEIKRGYIDHAMVVTGYTQLNSYWAPYPGEKSTGGIDATNPNSGFKACMRMQLDPSVNIDALGLTPEGKIVGKALQEYGMLVTDGASKSDFDIYFESMDFRPDGLRWGTLLQGALAAIPKNKLRIVESSQAPFPGYESEYNPVRVRTTQTVNLYSGTPFSIGTVRTTVPTGTTGVRLDPPVTVSGVTWWFINFDDPTPDSHYHSWVQADQLELVSTPPPPVPPTGGIYYVSPTGSDANPGSISSPFQTIQKAVDVARAGNTILVRGGIYNESVWMKYSGASGSPITLKNYPGEMLRINGPIGLISASGVLNPISWIVIEGFDINNPTGSPLTGNGIVLTNASNIIIRGNNIHHSKNEGIGGNGYKITVDRNTISYTGSQETDPANFNKLHGIYLTGTYISITNNIIHSNLAYGIQIAAYPYDSTKHAGVEYALAKNWLISNNVIAYQKNRSGIVVWQSGADNNTIQNNIFYDNSQTPGADDTHGILFYNGVGNIVRNNLFYSSNPNKIAIYNLAGSSAYTASNNVMQQNPAFVNALAFDFHLLSTSPAINTGIADQSPSVDFSGVTRPQGSAYDIGVYEFTGTVSVPPTSPAGCTYYASPSGGGNGLSQSSPFQIINFWGVPNLPGKTLCLLDGTYTGANSMIEVPLGINGTSASQITIRALNEGKAIIDGQDARRPLNGHGSWFVVEGVDFTRGDNDTIVLHPDAVNWILRRFISWNGGVNCDSQVRLVGQNSLVEDGGIFGPCRKQLFIGTGFTSTTNGNIARRIWARWEDNTHPTSNPTNACEVGYGQDGVTFENVICTRKYNPSPYGRGSVTEAEGAAELFRTVNSKWLGSIFYVPPDAGWIGGGLFSAFQDGGSGAPLKSAQNVTSKHLLGYLPPAYATVGNLRFIHVNNYPAGSTNIVSDSLGIGGAGNTIMGPSWTNGGNVNWYASLAGTPNHPFNLVPGVCKRYINGILTNEPLWPWPMNQRIINALIRAGYTGADVVDVTATMEQMFGQIPSVCKTSTAITPPPQPLLGDLNNDRTVNNFDWNLMVSVWFTSDVVADINRDGIVNTADYFFIYSNWGRTQ